MGRSLIVYYSSTGNTLKMAEFIGEGVRETGVAFDLKKVQDTSPEDLLNYDGIVVGCPTHYGAMPGAIKNLFDQSVKYHGRLAGKVGGAFTSSANIGGGNETTVLSVLHALLIHGMIIQGDAAGGHYGPVAIGAPDDRVRQECLRYGRRFGELLKKLYP